MQNLTKTLYHLRNASFIGEDIAPCPSCTLKIRVIFDEDCLPPLRTKQVRSSPLYSGAPAPLKLSDIKL